MSFSVQVATVSVIQHFCSDKCHHCGVSDTMLVMDCGLEKLKVCRRCIESYVDVAAILDVARANGEDALYLPVYSPNQISWDYISQVRLKKYF